MSKNSQELIILTSPPASGKTYWIYSLRKSFKTTSILVISPLRALADECRAKWGDDIQVMTPEEWLGKKKIADIVIFDEFHLFFYWGDSFRPLMWEMFFEVSQKSFLTFLLTATLNENMKGEILLFKTQFDSIYWVNNGNQKLMYKPFRYVQAPSRRWIQNQFECEQKNSDVKLIFCQYRQEVFALEKKLTSMGYSCVSCVGGEAKFMSQRLRDCPRPDFIISTTVLSHGVNLPAIKKIYFTYKVLNVDFWIQMVARGGRRGDRYQVFALEKPFELKWNKYLNFFIVLYFTIRQNFSRQKLFTPFQF
jgi:ATP-dependent DNA helicase RecQ